MSSGSFEWIKLDLDISEFDPTRFASIVRRVSDTGVELSTLVDEGDTTANRRRMYELNAVCSADIPERGEFHTWGEYQRVRLQSPSFIPAGVVLAIEGDAWVGMSGLSHRDGYDYAFADLTGTLASHRRRGIATAMKVAGIEFAKELGVSSIRTVHHPENSAMIALNRRLGFRDGDWEYPIR